MLDFNSVDMMDSCSCSSILVRIFMLKCYSISDSCLIFVSSLHFGGWVGMLQRVVVTWGGSLNAMPLAFAEAGKTDD